MNKEKEIKEKYMMKIQSENYNSIKLIKELQEKKPGVYG